MFFCRGRRICRFEAIQLQTNGTKWLRWQNSQQQWHRNRRGWDKRGADGIKGGANRWGQVKRENEGHASSQKLTAGLTETFFGLRSVRPLSL